MKAPAMGAFFASLALVAGSAVLAPPAYAATSGTIDGNVVLGHTP
ncbi:hypothetical protein [Streptomyces sp. NPDC048603]